MELRARIEEIRMAFSFIDRADRSDEWCFGLHSQLAAECQPGHTRTKATEIDGTRDEAQLARRDMPAEA